MFLVFLGNAERPHTQNLTPKLARNYMEKWLRLFRFHGVPWFRGSNVETMVACETIRFTTAVICRTIPGTLGRCSKWCREWCRKVPRKQDWLNGNQRMHLVVPLSAKTWRALDGGDPTPMAKSPNLRTWKLDIRYTTGCL